MTEHEANEHLWTVKDHDGVVHRAIRQDTTFSKFVITACDWWLSHNVSGERAPVRIDQIPTCIACTIFDWERPCLP